MPGEDYNVAKQIAEKEAVIRRLEEIKGRDAQVDSRFNRLGAEVHSVDQCSTQGCASEGPIGTADQEARYHLNTLISAKMNRIQQAQQDMTDAHYLQALMESLPTKMSHDAAMGLKILVRSYGNSPSRY